MGNEKSSNIFEEAAKAYASKKKSKEKERKSQEPAPSILSSLTETTITDEEIARLYKDAKKMYDTLRTQTSSIFQALGKNEAEVEARYSDPVFFSPQEQEIIQLQQQMLHEKLFQNVPKNQANEEVINQIKGTEQKSKTKVRKGRVEGKHKKWIRTD